MPLCDRCGEYHVRGRLPRGYDFDLCGACYLESGEYEQSDEDDLRNYAHFVYWQQSVDALRGRMLTNILVDEEHDELQRFNKWQLLALNTALLGTRPPVMATVPELRERIYDAFELGYTNEENDPSTAFWAYELSHLAIETAVVDPIHGLDTGESLRN